ncbi:hypothetical protein [Gluconobacter morbifer]|nr:hypothetical protein [Gluconobacter morbifer]
MKMQREMNFLTNALTDPDHAVFGSFCSLAQKSLPELNSCLIAAMARRKTGAQSAPAARHAQDAYVCIRNGKAGAPETSTCRTRFMLLKHHFHSVGHILGAMNILSSAVEDPSTGARADWPETEEDLGYRDIRAGYTILNHTDWDYLTTGTIALTLALQNELTVKQQTKPSPEPILRLHELVLIKSDIKAAHLQRGHCFMPEYRKKSRPVSPLTGIAFEPEPLFRPDVPKGFDTSTWITTSAFSCQASPSYRENNLFPTSLAAMGQYKTEAIDHDAEEGATCVITFSEVPEVFLDIFRKYIPPNQK